MDDIVIVFSDLGKLHGFLDILSRDLYSKAVTQGLEIMLFDLSPGQRRFTENLAVPFGARVKTWEIEG